MTNWVQAATPENLSDYYAQVKLGNVEAANGLAIYHMRQGRNYTDLSKIYPNEKDYLEQAKNHYNEMIRYFEIGVAGGCSASVANLGAYYLSRDQKAKAADVYRRAGILDSLSSHIKDQLVGYI